MVVPLDEDVKELLRLREPSRPPPSGIWRINGATNGQAPTKAVA